MGCKLTSTHAQGPKLHGALVQVAIRRVGPVQNGRRRCRASLSPHSGGTYTHSEPQRRLSGCSLAALSLVVCREALAASPAGVRVVSAAWAQQQLGWSGSMELLLAMRQVGNGELWQLWCSELVGDGREYGTGLGVEPAGPFLCCSLPGVVDLLWWNGQCTPLPVIGFSLLGVTFLPPSGLRRHPPGRGAEYFSAQAGLGQRSQKHSIQVRLPVCALALQWVQLGRSLGTRGTGHRLEAATVQDAHTSPDVALGLHRGTPP